MIGIEYALIIGGMALCLVGLIWLNIDVRNQLKKYEEDEKELMVSKDDEEK